MEFENIIRTTDTMTVRESVYSALPLPEGLAYQYTEIHSDGVRAIKVRMEHCIAEDESSITVYFARVDGAENLGSIEWSEPRNIELDPSQWHAGTVSHSQFAAPNKTVATVGIAVYMAMHVLAWEI